MADKAKKTFLSRDAILNAPDLTTEEVHVPEWGGWLMVKALTGAERDKFEESLSQRKGRKFKTNMANVRARLVALAAVDDAGKPLFRLNDVEALGKKSAAALDRVFDVAMRLAGMRQEDIDELTENFPADRNGNSPSG